MRRNEKRGQEQLKLREERRKLERSQDSSFKIGTDNTNNIGHKGVVYEEWLSHIDKKIREFDFILDRLDAIFYCYNQLILTVDIHFFKEAQRLAIDKKFLQMTIGSEVLGESEEIHYYDESIVSSKTVDQLYIVMIPFGIELTENDYQKYQTYHQMLGQIRMMYSVLNESATVALTRHPEILIQHANDVLNSLNSQ